jgi:hypothetical protein
MRLLPAAICTVSFFVGCEKDDVMNTPTAQRGTLPDAARHAGRSAIREFEVAALLDQADSEAHAAGALSKVMMPGQKAEDWICKVEWIALRESGEGSAFMGFKGMPPVYELLLMIHDKALESRAGLHVLNYDLKQKEYTVPNAELEKFKPGDWVMISGVVRDDTRVAWEESKVHWLQLGRLTLTHIEMLQK